MLINRLQIDFATSVDGLKFAYSDKEIIAYGSCAVEYSPFYGIEKGAVLQEARIFNQPNLDPRKCQQVRLLLIYVLNGPGLAHESAPRAESPHDVMHNNCF